MTRTPEQIRTRERYLKLETQLACLADDARDASNTASILTDGPEVPYLMWHDAADEMPKAIRRIENRLNQIKELWRKFQE